MRSNLIISAAVWTLALFRAGAQTPNTEVPALYIIGDSTASNNGDGLLGWAKPFAAYFDPTKIQVVNRARGGRSSSTFQTEGLWAAVLSELKGGDFVLIQFGHNDGGPLDSRRARGSLAGTGDETRQVIKPDGKEENVHTYGWYMRKYITDTRAKGATPIIVSLTVRNIWKDGKVERGSGNFGKWAKDIARAEDAPFVDVTGTIADRYEELGQEKVQEFFPSDHTHTNAAGANFNAAAIVAGLKKALAGSRLIAYLSGKSTPSLFLIGDSTVRNGQGNGANGQWGWGDLLATFFDQNKVNVINRARGGLSSRTYLTGGYWESTLALMKPGDFVLMQFGHNDNGPLDDTSRARGTIHGAGDETREIDNPITQQHEVVHTYGWYLRKYITDARTKGATPIVCSPVPRKIWKDGKIARSHDTYAGWAAEVAASEGVPFVDLNEIIAQRYDELGPDRVDPLFGDEHTHTSLAGAELNAACVVTGLKMLKENPLAEFLSDK